MAAWEHEARDHFTGEWVHGPDVPPIRMFPLSDVLGMESRDGSRVSSTLAAKRTTEKYRKLRDLMRSNGQQKPVDIYPGEAPGQKMLADGHNRVAVADELGWKTIAGYDFTAPRQAELSTCDHCGCPRPDSITEQIELGWHYNPAEHRDAHGRWTRGAAVPADADDFMADLPDRSVTGAILKEWRKTAKPSPEAIALNQASATWLAGDHDATLGLLDDATRAADAAGHHDDAGRYRAIADKIRTADEEKTGLKTPVRKLASAAVPAIDRMVGGRSAFNGKVYTWPDDDPQHEGIAAEMRWDGTMGVGTMLAREIQRTQADPHAQITDPVQYQDVLHELIHAELPPGESYQRHAPAYGASPAVQAIEEGFTELGAHHHAHEFFDAIGVGKRETQILSEGLGGYPVPDPAFGKAVAKYAADLQKQYVQLAYDPRAPQHQAAERLGAFIEQLKDDPEWIDVTDFSFSEIQHLGDPQLAKWAEEQRARWQKISVMPREMHTTMGELADRYDDPMIIDGGSGWGHYGPQTRAAQRWVQDVAEAEGVTDMRKGSPGFRRVKELTDEINREGPAGKDYMLASQVMRAAGRVPQDDPNLTALLGSYIRGQWMKDPDSGASLYPKIVRYLEMQTAPGPHKMAELSEAL